jgi:CBS domain-containing protein
MAARLVADITRGRTPLTLSTDENVEEACRRMRQWRVGAVLVTDAPHHLVGIFTGRDVVGRVVAEGRDPAKTKVSEVMTGRPSTISPGKRAIEALRQMQDGGYRHLPVVEDGTLLGIVSRNDFSGLEKARLEDETEIWERI